MNQEFLLKVNKEQLQLLYEILSLEKSKFDSFKIFDKKTLIFEEDLKSLVSIVESKVKRYAVSG